MLSAHVYFPRASHTLREFVGDAGLRLHSDAMKAPAAARIAFVSLAAIACNGAKGEETSTPPAAPATPIAAAAPAETALAAAKADTPEAAPAPAPAPEPKAPPVETVGGLTKLDDSQRASLLAGDEDAPFKVDTHYIQSNETRHDLWFPYIEGIGGACIGVGSDQTFTVAAHAKCELLFMMDIDTRVVELHRIYSVLVPRAESPQALVAMWSPEAEEQTKTLLEESLADMDEKDLRRLLIGFRVGRETVYRHLSRVVERTAGGEPASWLSDADKFAHMQALYETGRVRVMVGNLAGDKSLKTIAKACDDLGVKVRVLYMSNAEEYFKYVPDFVESIQGLPADDKSVVLRTIYSKKWQHADLWAYQVQPLLDFQTRLNDRKNRSRNPMMAYATYAGELDKTPGPEGLSLIALQPK